MRAKLVVATDDNDSTDCCVFRPAIGLNGGGGGRGGRVGLRSCCLPFEPKINCDCVNFICRDW